MTSATRKLNLNDDSDLQETSDGANSVFDEVVAFENIKGDAVVPMGEYALRNTKVELKTSKAGLPKFAIRTMITVGEFEGTPKYFDFSWAPNAQPRSKAAFVGMGLPENFRGSMRDIATALTNLEYFAVLDVEQSDQIDERTQKPYPDKNRIVATSRDRQTV